MSATKRITKRSRLPSLADYPAHMLAEELALRLKHTNAVDFIDTRTMVNIIGRYITQVRS